jgi:hypothetical protein
MGRAAGEQEFASCIIVRSSSDRRRLADRACIPFARCHASMIFSFAKKSASRRVCIGVFPRRHGADVVGAGCGRPARCRGRPASPRSLGRSVDLVAEGHPVELVQNGAMEALRDAISLLALGLGAAVVDASRARWSSYSCLWLPQNSVPRSVSTCDSRMPCSSTTRSLRISAAVIDVLRSYSLPKRPWRSFDEGLLIDPPDAPSGASRRG